MIKKLRIKLIAVSMLSLFFVLLIIMGTVNVLNYIDIVVDADNTLSILKENDGSFPKKGRDSHQSIGSGRKATSPELPYESRYFSVLLSATGEVISVDTGKIAAVNTLSAMEYAQNVWDSKNTHGFIDDYRYIVHSNDDNVRIIFLDCGRSLSTFRTFLLTSCGISILGLLAVLGLIILFSRRIIQPIYESQEKQKQFITDAGHELKTPITIINADTEVLEMEFGENEWLKDIQIQTKRLALLTNDLILLSRMEEEKPQLTMIEFPFSDLVFETSHSFQSLAKAQNKTFTMDIQPMLSIYGDEKTLRQLVSILLDNALKYSPANALISLKLYKEARYIHLTVENTVESISMMNLDHLFDRFYRGDKSRNSETKGYGLGLSIAKAIVETHKGRIQASSKDNNSLLIKVLLPAQDPKISYTRS